MPLAMTDHIAVEVLSHILWYQVIVVTESRHLLYREHIGQTQPQLLDVLTVGEPILLGVMKRYLAVSLCKIVGRRIVMLVINSIEQVSLVVTTEVQSVDQLGVVIDLNGRGTLRGMTCDQRCKSLQRNQSWMRHKKQQDCSFLPNWTETSRSRRAQSRRWHRSC